MKTIALVLFASSAAAISLGGCRASPLKDRFDSVGKEISAAKSAGAPDYSPVDYEGAESALRLAKGAETRALDDREDAEEERANALRELDEMNKLGADREMALGEAETRKAGAEARLADLERRVAQLRAKGVSEKEIDRALGDDITLTQLDLSSAKATIKTIKAEVELVGARRMEMQARVKSAEDMKAAASQQLLHASALCDTAAASARAAKAHATAKRKAELEVR